MPQFSVIIPTRDRPASLQLCLDAISRLAPPEGGFEVIVVDDGGQQIVDWAVFPQNLRAAGRIFRVPVNLGPAAARNLGARAANGKYLAFTDDDCAPARDWLRRLLESFDVHPDAACGGPFVAGKSNCLFTSASHSILAVVYSYYNRDPKRAQFMGTANFAVPANRFAEIGGFNEAFRTSEDREFCRRWVRRGWPLVFVPDAVVEHYQRCGFVAFVRRHFHYGMGAYRFRSLDVRQSDPRVTLEPLSFYWSLLTYPLHSACWPRAPLVAGMVFVSQVASGLGFLAARFSAAAPPAQSQSSIGRS